ncbi:hypothetical protein ONZ51_g586 [Trametes cubensis]|uniref:Uncharacterized protein n=1 Tax=Trametes cubensis TaxID=1111947 RepID=A0AAD7U356_9APHY|nr:hypothetical protein ONZ51_g586 [Trametes cubensis]
MPSTIIDVSSALGEYMLKGWILTDRICSKCGKVPMMRSPSAVSTSTQFCVNCDPGPASNDAAGPSNHTVGHSRVSQSSTVPDTSSVSTISYGTDLSRSSTPPTEVSVTPDSPPLVPIMDTAELLRRRQQSDTASAEIGRRMLQGWAMLADECPNPTCYGIPLECVICGVAYVDGRDAVGQDRLVPMQSAPPSEDTNRLSAPTVGSSTATATQVAIDRGKGKARHDAPLSADDHSDVLPQARTNLYVNSQAVAPVTPSSTSSALEVSARSLENSLLALSARLDSLSKSPILDPTPIGSTADTISKVSQALTQVKQLLWSEGQARIA